MSFAGLKIGTPFMPSKGWDKVDYCNGGSNYALGKAAKDAGIQYCYLSAGYAGNLDYWAEAMFQCKKAGGHLATLEDIGKIASYLYGANIGATTRYRGSLKQARLKDSPFVGLGSDYYVIWSSSGQSQNSVAGRTFGSQVDKTDSHTLTQYNRNIKYMGFCVK
ncbi:hypothetical protein J6G99_03610 [bacterium]|nr:hypothetical protein [bacterium]